MKRLTLAILCAAGAMLVQKAMAQTHLRGQPFLQIDAGSYDAVLPGLGNFAFKAGLGKYTRRLWGSMFFVSVAHKQTSLVSEGSRVMIETDVPVDQYMAGYQLTPNLYQSAMRTFLVKLPLSLQAGYECLNRGEDFIGPYLLAPSSRVLLGAGAALEFEYRGVLVGYRQNVNLLSRYQKFSSLPYVGYKIHFR
ncbi:conjugal transfer protein TraO [Persicitalea jodogahamensis]|uniref:Outer membrane protein beta-barrel domain-containing protein n=1 Tax=Persicitalea jodogahamensis TaxID=402147 RepID=A0A8J3D5W0_9BACT|nr:conjugal transfer protein TraO [Persicitalea jodogahamensis]GHB87434.1 hypothetical protein GCM10007390_49140 [Persicitalea jodogahamensis]